MIGVIGILSALAIPNVSRVNDSAKKASSRRNAQNLASICASAQAAGLNFVDKEGSLEVTVEQVVSGGLVSGGVYDGSFFGLPNLSEEAQERAQEYLALKHGLLIYTENPISVLKPPNINGPDGPAGTGDDPLLNPVGPGVVPPPPPDPLTPPDPSSNLEEGSEA